MPADADLLCEYYILSNLNKPPATSFIPAQTKPNPSDLSAYGAIEFVKYDKSPMDALKSKYQVMSCGGSSPPISVPQISVKEQPAASSIAHNTQVAATAAASSSLAPSASKSAGCWLDLNWSRIRKTGIGLINLGNNCYLNATLQCLAYTAPLSQWLVCFYFFTFLEIEEFYLVIGACF